MTVLEFLKGLRDYRYCCPNADDQGHRPVSNKQLSRWIDSGGVLINNRRMSFKDPMPEDITSLVFFSKNAKKKITIW